MQKKESGLLKSAVKAYGKATLAAMTFGTSLAVSGAMKYGKKKKQEAALSTVEIDIYQKIEDELKKEEEIKRKVTEIISSPDYKQVCYVIPEDYRFPDTISYMVSILKQGRADTWKELANLYHDDLFKQELIEINLEQLDIQNELLENAFEILSEVQDMNEEVHYMNEIQEMILGIDDDQRSILMQKMVQDNQFMKTQSEMMKKMYKNAKRIGKNTKRARRSVGLLSFIEVAKLIF